MQKILPQEINLFVHIFVDERLISCALVFVQRRSFEKKRKWQWNISHNFAKNDIDLLAIHLSSEKIDLLWILLFGSRDWLKVFERFSIDDINLLSIILFIWKIDLLWTHCYWKRSLKKCMNLLQSISVCKRSIFFVLILFSKRLLKYRYYIMAFNIALCLSMRWSSIGQFTGWNFTQWTNQQTDKATYRWILPDPKKY